MFMFRTTAHNYEKCSTIETTQLALDFKSNVVYNVQTATINEPQIQLQQFLSTFLTT
jgi:hypothetical protein